MTTQIIIGWINPSAGSGIIHTNPACGNRGGRGYITRPIVLVLDDGVQFCQRCRTYPPVEATPEAIHEASETFYLLLLAVGQRRLVAAELAEGARHWLTNRFADIATRHAQEA